MSKITTYDFIAANKRKTVLLMCLFPISLLALFYLVLFLYFYSTSEAPYLYSVVAQTNHIALGLLPVIGFFSVLCVLISYFSGHSFIMLVAGGVELNETNAPEIVHIVENIAITAGLPMPRVYAINDDGLNAFATGRDPKHSYIAITKGLANTLSKDELEGVIAHEMSHIKNYDIRIMLITIVCISFATIAAEVLLRMSFFSGGSRDNKKGAGIGTVLLILAIVLFIYGYLLAPLIRLAISRTREFQADANAALITRNPAGLINALRKISNNSQVKSLSDKETIAAICIESPLRNNKKDTIFAHFSGLFNTHPSIEERIRALEIMGGITANEKI